MSSGIDSCKRGNFNDHVVLGVKCRCKRMVIKCNEVKRYLERSKNERCKGSVQIVTGVELLV